MQDIDEGTSKNPKGVSQPEFDAEQLKELSRLRTAFYTNITHEFRTPLTVITGMADMIEENPEYAEEAVSMIKRNSANLLTLVNQMLDLSKLDSGAMTLKMMRSDVIAYINYIVESLHSFAETHGVDLQCHHKHSSYVMDYDAEKLMQVLSNLIANGIKFTPKGGYVEVWTHHAVIGGTEEFHISVRDSGIGIGVEHIPYIFDRFYRVEDTAIKTSKGTGIGLALTKDLVDLMQGNITIESDTGKGATFLVSLPVTRNAEEEEFKLTVEEVRAASASYVSRHLPVIQEHKDYAEDDPSPVVLVVEDNQDVARYIGACLGKDYNLDFAANGATGIDRAIQTVPDIVVTDVMMPVKDGFELCSTLKVDPRTSHIPIIMLTAKADMQSRIEGLEHGADAYLNKPFNKEELHVRLRKLLELRKALQSRYNSGEALDSANSDSPKIEDAFITKLNEVIHEHIDDTEFGIMQTARAMTLSRAQLHNKIKALTGRSTGLYIRYVRLLQSRKLLNDPDLHISEIAYDVGFSDPAYFTRCFKDEFGKAPSEFR